MIYCNFKYNFKLQLNKNKISNIYDKLLILIINNYVNNYVNIYDKLYAKK